jgi:tRNA 2-thiouridine synthesizing protein A
MTRKALARFPEGVQVITDNTTARDNVTRFAKSSGYSVATEQQGFEYILTLTRK